MSTSGIITKNKIRLTTIWHSGLLYLLINLPILAQPIDTTLLRHVNLIPMTEEGIIADQDVLISGTKIIKISTNLGAFAKDSWLIIDGNGKYLIPGLSEMHYHWRSVQTGIERDLKLLLANGITTVRNMAEYEGQDHINIRDQIQSGQIIGPTYYTTGPYLKKDHLASHQQIDEVISTHESRGYDFLKIADNIPKNLYLYLLEKAEEFGIPVIGHAQRKLPLEYSLRMKSIEHAEEFVYLFNREEDYSYLNFDQNHLIGTARQIAASGCYVTPTLVVFEFITHCVYDSTFQSMQRDSRVRYLPPDQRAKFLTEKNEYRQIRDREFSGIRVPALFDRYFKWMKMYTGLLHQHHVKLLTGSDTFGMVLVGFSLHREFELLQDCGLKPYDILLASTVNAARYLDRYAQEGTISEGKLANLVLLRENPLEDIRNTQLIDGVFHKGKWYDRESLQKMLDDGAFE